MPAAQTLMVAQSRNPAHLLAGVDVYLFGWHCVMEEIDRSERARGHRRIGVSRTPHHLRPHPLLRALRPGSDRAGRHGFLSVAALRH
jgi:chloramphenicol 3-O-phosphotransferase